MSVKHGRGPRRRTNAHSADVGDGPGRPCAIGSDGSGYTPEQEAWLRACDRYRSERRKRFLSAVDYLDVLKGLGYRLPDGPPEGKE